MKQTIHTFLLVILFPTFSWGCNSQPNTIYVSPAGSPYNSGTTCDSPVTYDRGRQLMQQMLHPTGDPSAGPSGAFTLWFLPGVYQFGGTNTLGLLDSPKWDGSSYVVWKGEGSVILSGGMQKPFQGDYGYGNRWRMGVGRYWGSGQPDAIWDLQGKRLTPTRSSPLSLDIPNPTNGNQSNFFLDSAPNGGQCYRLRVNQSGLIHGSKLVLQNSWEQTKLNVIDINASGQPCFDVASTKTGAVTIGYGAPNLRNPKQTHYFEGVFKPMQSGEFFYDGDNGHDIYYTAANDEGTLILPRVTTLLRIQGAHDISFYNIQFQHNSRNNSTDFVVCQADFLGNCDPSTMGQKTAPAAVEVRDGVNIAFDHVAWAHLGTTALAFYGGYFNRVQNSTIVDIGGSGISVFTASGDKTTFPAYGLEISGVYLISVGLSYAGSAGIFSTACSSCSLHHNVISDSRHSLLSFGWNGGFPNGSNSIHDNQLLYYLQPINKGLYPGEQLWDGGGAYFRGDNALVNPQAGYAAFRQNVIQHGPRSPLTEGGASDIFLDDDAQHVSLIGNFTDDSSIGLKIREEGGVKNNYFYYNRSRNHWDDANRLKQGATPTFWGTVALENLGPYWFFEQIDDIYGRNADYEHAINITGTPIYVWPSASQGLPVGWGN